MTKKSHACNDWAWILIGRRCRPNLDILRKKLIQVQRENSQ